MASEVTARGKGRGPAKDDGRPVHVWPHLVSIELIAALVFTVILSLMAIFFKAPLLSLANPELTPNPAKAPWYFLGLQELLLHMHPALAGVIVPTAVLVMLGAIPYIDKSKKAPEFGFTAPREFPSRSFPRFTRRFGTWVSSLWMSTYPPAKELESLLS